VPQGRGRGVTYVFALSVPFSVRYELTLSREKYILSFRNNTAQILMKRAEIALRAISALSARLRGAAAPAANLQAFRQCPAYPGAGQHAQLDACQRVHRLLAYY